MGGMPSVSCPHCAAAVGKKPPHWRSKALHCGSPSTASRCMPSSGRAACQALAPCPATAAAGGGGGGNAPSRRSSRACCAAHAARLGSPPIHAFKRRFIVPFAMQQPRPFAPWHTTTGARCLLERCCTPATRTLPLLKALRGTAAVLLQSTAAERAVCWPSIVLMGCCWRVWCFSSKNRSDKRLQANTTKLYTPRGSQWSPVDHKLQEFTWWATTRCTPAIAHLRASGVYIVLASRWHRQPLLWGRHTVATAAQATLQQHGVSVRPPRRFVAMMRCLTWPYRGPQHRLPLARTALHRRVWLGGAGPPRGAGAPGHQVSACWSPSRGHVAPNGRAEAVPAGGARRQWQRRSVWWQVLLLAANGRATADGADGMFYSPPQVWRSAAAAAAESAFARWYRYNGAGSAIAGSTAYMFCYEQQHQQ